MAEERILELPGETDEPEESKEELQRRLELTRHSISNTMSEIKETVANQVQAVKDTFDWREQFKKRPVAWSVGALGVGFVTGYKIADAFKHSSTPDYFAEGESRYPPQPKMEQAKHERDVSWSADDRDRGPGVFERFKESSVYDSLSKETSSLGRQLVGELSSTAHLVVLPFLVTKLKEWVGLDRLEKSQPAAAARAGVGRSSSEWREPERTPGRESTLGHN